MKLQEEQERVVRKEDRGLALDLALWQRRWNLARKIRKASSKISAFMQYVD